MFRTRMSMAGLLVVIMGGLAHGDRDDGGIVPLPVPPASINYAVGYPKGGANKGELSVVVEWANVTGIARVTSTMYKNVTINGVVSKEVVCSSGKGVTFVSSQWTFSETNLKNSGDIVIEGKLEARDGIGANSKVLADDNPTLNVTIP